jgi:group I intron endonuclease
MEDKIKVSGIYCYENLTDGKRYTGQAQDISAREKAHSFRLKSDKCKDSKYFKNAWNLYGAENFKFYVVEECAIELLNEREIFWIKELHSHFTEWGYNISWGGGNFNRGLKASDETRKMMSESRMGHVVTEETKMRISKANMGHIVTEKTRKKLSESTSGENNHNFGKTGKDTSQFGKHRTAEANQKRSESMSGENNPMWGKTGSSHPKFGKHLSEESKQRQSEANTGEKNPMFGEHHSEEWKQKKSEAMSSENNPMFGKSGKDSPNFGKHHTKDAKEKMSDAWTEEMRKKQSEIKRTYWKNKKEQNNKQNS